MINISRAHDDNILSIVVRLMKIDHHIPVNLVNIVDISKDWLTHHMSLENVVVDTFHQCFHVVLICGKQLLPNCVLLLLQMIVIVSGMAKHVS